MILFILLVVLLLYIVYYLQNDYTPLHCASNRGCTEIVQILLSNGASIEAKNIVSITQTVLHSLTVTHTTCIA